MTGKKTRGNSKLKQTVNIAIKLNTPHYRKLDVNKIITLLILFCSLLSTLLLYFFSFIDFTIYTLTQWRVNLVIRILDKTEFNFVLG